MRRLGRFAWGVVALNVLVILWGAYVRATGSGAGCGSHWPLCDGQVLPRARDAQTLIEFIHRLSSGAALLAVFALLVWVLRAVARGQPARRAAIWAAFFMALEAALGAWLVLAELVAGNTSLLRGVTSSLHLLNTLLLLGSLTLTAHFLGGGATPRPRRTARLTGAMAVALAGVLALGMTGAIAALGDTLFPAASLRHGVQADLSPSAHAFIRLRALHPLLAALVGVYILAMAWRLAVRHSSPRVRTYAWRAGLLVAIQLAAGVINLALLAPIWMQILHLLLADLVWISLILLAAQAMAEPADLVPA
jgi:heme A synthase